MGGPLHKTSEDVLPYVPDWARRPDYRTSIPEPANDPLGDSENPSYREVAQMFAPQMEHARSATAQRKNRPAGILLRFGIVVGVAAVVLAIFVGYVMMQPGGKLAAENRLAQASDLISVPPVQATLGEAPAPIAPPVPAAVEPAAAAPVESAQTPLAIDTNTALSSAEPTPVAEAAAAPDAAPVRTEVAALPSEGPAAAAPVMPHLNAAELATLMARGRRFIETGDFSSARPVYRRAAEAGYAEAALALGETYDPSTLTEHGVVGMSGNAEQARHWYERARDLGSLEAPTRLDRLAAK